MKLDRLEDLFIPYVKGILYGEPGSGKTTLAASAEKDPRMSPALLLNCVGNPISIRNMRPAPFLFHINDINDIENVYNWLIDEQPEDHMIPRFYKGKFGVELPKFKTVIGDQLTGLQGLFMRSHLGNRKMTDHKKAEFDDWAALLQWMDAIAFGFFENLQMHVIFTALERVEINRLSKTASWGIGLMGQSQQVVPSYAPLVARLVRQKRNSDLDKKEFRLTDKAYNTAFFDILGKFNAKDQYGLGVTHMEDRKSVV